MGHAAQNMVNAKAINRNCFFHQQHTVEDTMADEVHAGLSQVQKTLSPKFFYDKRGSELFDQITTLPEYYPTRTEISLLKKHADEMADLVGEDSFLLELGSGSSVKIRLLLEAMMPKIYVPMDISGKHLTASAEQLVSEFPWLTVHAVCVDYSRPWTIPDFGPGSYNAFFPGSSIGNFEPRCALTLLQQIRRLVGEGGGLLIGVDLKKDPDILETAYNDNKGVTAAFNLNVLNHINRALEADFEQENFAHQAVYNLDKGRIEMHLECLKDHSVKVEDSLYHFTRGETIHTENSYKYSVDEFHDLAGEADFSPARVWTDENNLFSLHYLIAK